MAFSISSKLGNVVSALNDANTTTAAFDLSSNLAHRIQHIEADDPAVRPARDDEHPFIWVWVGPMEQDFDELGVNAVVGVTKRMKVTYKILATIHKSGMTAQHKTALDDIYKLADNINTLFQNNLTLSATALWCNAKAIEFLGPVGKGGNYIKGALIDLEAVYLYR